MTLEPDKFYAVNMWTKEVDVSQCFKCVFGAISHGNDRANEGNGPYAPWRGRQIMADPQFKYPGHGLPVSG
jgi:hypothetical protein